MKAFFPVLISLVFAHSVCAKGLIYRCEDAEGKTVYKKSPCTDEKQMVSQWQEPEQARKKVSVRQGLSGHYFLDGSLNNGKSVKFVIDTGASGVVVSEAMARQANLAPCAEKKIAASTANGVTYGCVVNIAVLAVGPFKIKDVKTMVLPAIDYPLLGMNVLGNFDIKQDHGELTITGQ